MYSPRIMPHFVRLLYLRAKELSQKEGRRVPMTKLVNDIINEYLYDLAKDELKQNSVDTDYNF